MWQCRARTFRNRRNTRDAVSGTPVERMKAMYSGQMRSCCVIGSDLRARSN